VDQILSTSVWEYNPDGLSCSKPPNPPQNPLDSSNEDFPEIAHSFLSSITFKRWPDGVLLYKLHNSLPQIG